MVNDRVGLALLRQRFKKIAFPAGVAVLLLLVPTQAYAHAFESVAVFSWGIIFVFQMVCMFLMLKSKRMERRYFLASLLYISIVGIIWGCVFWGFQSELSDPELERKLKVTNVGLAQRLERQRLNLNEIFGREHGGNVQLALILGLPLLLPPIMAFVFYKVSRTPRLRDREDYRDED